MPDTSTLTVPAGHGSIDSIVTFPHDSTAAGTDRRSRLIGASVVDVVGSASPSAPVDVVDVAVASVTVDGDSVACVVVVVVVSVVVVGSSIVARLGSCSGRVARVTATRR